LRDSRSDDVISLNRVAIAPIFVPSIAGRSQRSRWSSVPNSASAGVAMSVCTPIAIGTPPQRIWPSVSRNTIW